MQIKTRKEQASSNDSQGAMEARDLVKQLFEAALHGCIADIQELAPSLSPSGLSSVKDGNGSNALHFAAQGGQLETVDYLLHSEGISVNSQDDSGTVHSLHSPPNNCRHCGRYKPYGDRSTERCCAERLPASLYAAVFAAP